MSGVPSAFEDHSHDHRAAGSVLIEDGESVGHELSACPPASAAGDVVELDVVAAGQWCLPRDPCGQRQSDC